MDLLDHIKHKRTQKIKKQPFEREVFTKISTLVRHYGLDENFLKHLDTPEDYPPGEKMDFLRVKPKKPFEFPLFSLCSRDEYDLTQALLRKVNNPYLSFAHSPEEILMSGMLYHMNAKLRPEALRRYDFETLLAYEHAKKYLKELANQAAQIGKTTDTGRETETIKNKKSQFGTLTEHVKLLHTFVKKVESTSSESE